MVWRHSAGEQIIDRVRRKSGSTESRVNHVVAGFNSSEHTIIGTALLQSTVDTATDNVARNAFFTQ